ncbi:MAG: M28 family peptidase, partial [Anaerolineaceae bacterium]|nr:M28 family peptidase [Anaerolineaceae bacterium]
ILDPPIGHIPSTAVYFTPDTPEEGLTGELLFVEEGQETQLGPQMKDKIILWSPIARGQVPRELSMYNPLAVVIISVAPGFQPRHDCQQKHFFEPYNPITAFRVTWEIGHRLVQAGAKKARVKLQSKTFKSQGRNIIAEIKGSDHPEEIIVVCAHYDSPPDTPSATDTASGTAMMLEFARIYAGRGSRRTLRFIAFDGEETGFLGSIHYLKKLKEKEISEQKAQGFVTGRDKTEFQKHLFCLNLDVLGMALGHNTCFVLGPPEVTATIKVLSKELGVPHQVTEDVYGSDNDPFALAGVPGVTFSRMGSSFNYIHTDGDIVDLINPKQIQQVGHLVDTFLLRTAAQARVWPFERAIPENLARKIEDMLKKWMGKGCEKIINELKNTS